MYLNEIYFLYQAVENIILTVFYFGKENRKMELILLFVVYVIVMAFKDAYTPRRKAFDVGEYCRCVQKYGQEEADRRRESRCFDLL